MSEEDKNKEVKNILLELEKIKIIIADDDIKICEEIKDKLKNYESIGVIGIANTDEEEIRMIEELKPDVVVTDLMRNHKFTGLDIIKAYSEKDESPKFIIVSFSPDYGLWNIYKNIADYVFKFPYINDSELAYKIIYAKRTIIKEKNTD